MFSSHPFHLGMLADACDVTLVTPAVETFGGPLGFLFFARYYRVHLGRALGKRFCTIEGLLVYANILRAARLRITISHSETFAFSLHLRPRRHLASVSVPLPSRWHIGSGNDAIRPTLTFAKASFIERAGSTASLRIDPLARCAGVSHSSLVLFRHLLTYSIVEAASLN